MGRQPAKLAFGILIAAAATGAAADTNSEAAAKNLDAKAARSYVSARLEEFCQRANPHLNYIKVSVRGNAVYCVHDLFGRYTLSAGAFGPALGSWVSQNEGVLLKAKIKKVGVWGTGSYSSGAWFEVK